MSVFDVAFAHPCAYTRMDALVLCAWLFPAVASFLFACLCGFRFLRVSFDFYYKMLVFVDENYYICNI